MRLRNDVYEVVAEGFRVPLLGVNVLNGNIYVSHKGVISVIKSDGTRQDIITGLPSNGDYGNSKVVFGHDGKMYFGQGSATNSGVVGLDNTWVFQYPYFHDFPAEDIKLIGQNFPTYNFLSYYPMIIHLLELFVPMGHQTERVR